MTISNKQAKGGTAINAAAEGRDPSAKPKFSLFTMLYKWFKYGTMIGVVVAIVLAGVVILGQVEEQIGQQESIQTLFKSSSEMSDSVEAISKLLNSKKGSFISTRTISLYLEQKPNKNVDQKQLDGRFTDMTHFVHHFLTQRYADETVLKFPLDLYGKNFLQVVDEPITSKALRLLKTKVQTVLEKNSLEKSDSTKQLKWSRLKKLLDGGKFDDILSLLQQNAVNWACNWIGNPSKVIVLYVDESKISKSNDDQVIQKNKKLLKKWIQQHQDDHEIIIVSKYSINNLYDQNKEQNFKSFRVDTGLKNFNNQAICNFLKEYQQLNQKQCDFFRRSFDTLDGLYNYVDSKNEQEQEKSWQIDLSDKKKEVNKVLEKVCEKGQIKYYFYENQENINKVLTRNKKAKKSRLDRELDALLVKYSEIKDAMGLNRIKDIYKTFFDVDEENEKLTLREANSIGLIYDFQQHYLKWKSDEQRLAYELRAEKNCGGQESDIQVEKQDQEDKNVKKEEKDEEQQVEEEQVVDEEEQQTGQEEEYLEEEYEQNPIHYNHNDQDDEETNEAEENEISVEQDVLEDQEQNEELIEEQVDQEEQNVEQDQISEEDDQNLEDIQEEEHLDEDAQDVEEKQNETAQTLQQQEQQSNNNDDEQQANTSNTSEHQQQVESQQSKSANTQIQQQQQQQQEQNSTQKSQNQQQNTQQQPQNTQEELQPEQTDNSQQQTTTTQLQSKSQITQEKIQDSQTSQAKTLSSDQQSVQKQIEQADVSQ